MKQLSKSNNLPRNLVMLGTGVSLGFLINIGNANLSPPSEHKGLEVKTLGSISSESMNIQLGLQGYKMQLREISIEPGGHIARHSHANRPGLVKVVKGTWTEGRPESESDYSSSDGALLEDSSTDHWFYNLGSEVAVAYVCDIVPQE